QPAPTAITWPYSSSYHLTASAFDRLQSRSIRTNSSRRISSGWYFGQFLVPTNSDVGPPRISDVSFPASKVHLHELLQRHEGPPGAQWLYALPDSITAMLRFDGSAGFAIGRDLN